MFDIRTTFGVFGVIFDGMDRAAADALDEVYERANGDPMGSLDADSGYTHPVAEAPNRKNPL